MRIRVLLFSIFVGILVIRVGTFVVRIAKELGQPATVWQPANSNERMIWDNYRLIGQ